MGLVSVDVLLSRAEREGYAVGAFNANNMEIVQAIMMAEKPDEIDPRQILGPAREATSK